MHSAIKQALTVSHRLVPTKPDVDIFCYLCVRPKGAAVPRYMTEGLFLPTLCAALSPLSWSSLHTHNHTLTYPLSLALVVTMKSTEFKTLRSILMLIL